MIEGVALLSHESRCSIGAVYEALKQAIHSGSCRAVKLLLPRLDLEVSDAAVDEQSCLLNPAAQQGHADVLTALIEWDNVHTDARFCRYECLGAIESAALNGHLDCVDVLLQACEIRGIPANIALLYALDKAARGGHADLVTCFLADARLNASESRCLRSAVEEGHEDIVKIVLRDGRASTQALLESLKSAAEKGDAAILRRILKSVPCNAAELNCRSQYTTALGIAADKGYADVVRVLLGDARIDPNAYSAPNTPLEAAATRGHAGVVRMLLADKRTNAAVNNSRALSDAAENGHLEITQQLLAAPSIRPCARQSAALRVAVWRGHTAVVKALLDDGRVDPMHKKGAALRCAKRLARETNNSEILTMIQEACQKVTTAKTDSGDAMLVAAGSKRKRAMGS